VATASADFKVKVWNVSLNAWDLLTTYTQHTSIVNDLEWLNADTLVSVGQTENLVRIWSLNSGVSDQTISLPGQVSNTYCIKLLNTTHLAVGMSPFSQGIQIYKLSDGSRVGTLNGHTGSVRELILVGDSLLASGSSDNSVRIWDLTTSISRWHWTGHEFGVKGLKKIGSDVLASGSDDSNIKLWNITSGSGIRTLSGHTNQIFFSVDLINSSTTLVSGSEDQKIKFWDWTTGVAVNTTGTGSNIKSLAVIYV
jgi:WD40 repeat protein